MKTLATKPEHQLLAQVLENQLVLLEHFRYGQEWAQEPPWKEFEKAISATKKILCK